MDLSRSIDFLLENAGDVIQYRLHKEILCDINKTEEEILKENGMNFRLDYNQIEKIIFQPEKEKVYYL